MSRDTPFRCPEPAHCPRYKFQARDLRISGPELAPPPVHGESAAYRPEAAMGVTAAPAGSAVGAGDDGNMGLLAVELLPFINGPDVLTHGNIVSLTNFLGHVADPCVIDLVDAAARQLGTQALLRIEVGIARTGHCGGIDRFLKDGTGTIRGVIGTWIRFEAHRPQVPLGRLVMPRPALGSFPSATRTWLCLSRRERRGDAVGQESSPPPSGDASQGIRPRRSICRPALPQTRPWRPHPDRPSMRGRRSWCPPFPPAGSAVSVGPGNRQVTDAPEPRSSWPFAWPKEWRKALDAAYVAWYEPGADAAIEGGDEQPSLVVADHAPQQQLGQVHTRADVEIDEGQVRIEAGLVEPTMNTDAGVESGGCHRTVQLLGAGIQGVDAPGLGQVNLHGRDPLS
jgi:hypothetical protein